MQTLQSAKSHYAQQQQITATTVASANKLWRRMGNDFDSSWGRISPLMLDTVQLGRAAVATTSVGYTAAVLKETGQNAPAVGEVNPSAFLSSAPDGRSMSTLLDESVIHAKVAVGRGATVPFALRSAEVWLTGTLLTVMADTGRAVVGADIAQRPTLTGYVRMVNPGACKDCIILAGKWFRWNQGFLRHKNCMCRHIPAAENAPDDFRTDPYAYFHSLAPEDQEAIFGRVEARSINDGADIYRVVNLKSRGLGTAKSNLRYGTPSKMTIDDIYRTAGTRTNAIKMMTEQGYITGPQVAGGNVLGFREGFGALGKGGKARAASDAVVAARASGVRDPLNRYTMTAAERRLYDTQYRLNEALRTGNWPRSIGVNSADIYSKPRPLAGSDLATLKKAYQNEVDKLKNAPESVKRLARLLGIL